VPKYSTEPYIAFYDNNSEDTCWEVNQLSSNPNPIELKSVDGSQKVVLVPSPLYSTNTELEGII
jgi:hypothetical protein